MRMRRLRTSNEDIKQGRDIFMLNESLLYRFLVDGKIDHTKGYIDEDGVIDDSNAPHFHPKKTAKDTRKVHIFIRDGIKNFEIHVCNS